MKSPEAGQGDLLSPTLIVHEELSPKLEPVAILTPCSLNPSGVNGISKSRAKKTPQLFREPNQVELGAVDLGEVGEEIEGEWDPLPFHKVKETSPGLVPGADMISDTAPPNSIISH